MKVYALYGRWEFRARMPKNTATAIWPALWMMPNSKTTVPPWKCWPTAGEIDIVAGWKPHRRPHIFQPTLGRGLRPRQETATWESVPIRVFAPNRLFSRFPRTVFAVEWSESALVFSVDGNDFFTLTNATGFIPNSPFYGIINTAVSPLVPIGPFAEYPAWHIVDWMRIYLRRDAPWTGQVGATSNPNHHQPSTKLR